MAETGNSFHAVSSLCHTSLAILAEEGCQASLSGNPWPDVFNEWQIWRPCHPGQQSNTPCVKEKVRTQCTTCGLALAGRWCQVGFEYH